MKKLMTIALALMTLAAGSAYAEEGSNSAALNTVGQILRSPITVLDKLSNIDSDSRATSSGSEGVVVSEIYDLDQETTG